MCKQQNLLIIFISIKQNPLCAICAMIYYVNWYVLWLFCMNECLPGDCQFVFYIFNLIFVRFHWIFMLIFVFLRQCPIRLRTAYTNTIRWCSWWNVSYYCHYVVFYRFVCLDRNFAHIYISNSHSDFIFPLNNLRTLSFKASASIYSFWDRYVHFIHHNNWNRKGKEMKTSNNSKLCRRKRI